MQAATGKELWSRNILKEFQAKNITWALSECLLVDGPRVIVTPGGERALMAALDRTDGRTIWTTEGLAGDNASYSSPILFRYEGRRLIANCSSAHGFVVDADDGRLLGSVPLRNQFGVNSSTPIYGSGRLYFVTPYAEQGRQYRLSLSDRGIDLPLAWQSSLDTVTGGGVFVQGTLYSAGYKASKWWFGIDWENGQTLGEYRDLTTGAAIWAEERLYCLDEKGRWGSCEPTGRSGSGRVNSRSFPAVFATPGRTRSFRTVVSIYDITTPCSATMSHNAGRTPVGRIAHPSHAFVHRLQRVALNSLGPTPRPRVSGMREAAGQRSSRKTRSLSWSKPQSRNLPPF